MGAVMDRNEKIAVGLGFLAMGGALAYLFLKRPPAVSGVVIQTGSFQTPNIGPNSYISADDVNNVISVSTVDVTFDRPFSTTPTVVLNPASYRGLAIFTVPGSVSPAGFTAYFYNHTHDAWAAGAFGPISYMAVGT
jgi:hypothetical protein